MVFINCSMIEWDGMRVGGVHVTWSAPEMYVCIVKTKNHI